MLLFVAAEDTRKEAAGRVLGACGGAWFVVPCICVYVAWLGGGAIMPGTRTRPEAAREGEGRERPLLQYRGYCNWASGFLNSKYSRFTIHNTR